MDVKAFKDKYIQQMQWLRENHLSILDETASKTVHREEDHW